MDITVFESTTFMELKYENQFIFATSEVNLFIFKPCVVSPLQFTGERVAPRQHRGARTARHGRSFGAPGGSSRSSPANSAGK